MLPNLEPIMQVANSPKGWKTGLVIFILGGLAFGWFLSHQMPTTNVEAYISFGAIFVAVSLLPSGLFMILGSLMLKRLRRKKRKTEV